MARSYDSLWWGTAATFTAASAALIGAAAALYSNKGSYIWISGPAVCGYIAFFVAILCLLGAVRYWRFPLARDSSSPKDSILTSISLDRDNVAASLLADVVQKRWKDEAKARHIEASDLISVLWQGDDELYGHALKIDSAVTGQMDQVKGMVDQFLALTPHRLILVGPPGSGKTALAILMMLELLRRHSEAVPVMLSLSSWDLQSSLRMWIKGRIVSEYKPGDVDSAEWAAVIERLIQQDLIIPVLDGLDELAPEMRGSALKAINTILPAQALILACRREDYSKASQHSGPLKNAAASVALPVAQTAVASYLRKHSGPKSAHSWEPILDKITADPSSPLARVLSRPLMVSLLPVVYDSPETDASELLDKQRFDSQEAIESQLYGGLLRTYDDHFHISLDDQSRWNPAQARRWLTNLARHLSRSQIYDIVYWQLPHAIGRKQRLLVALSASLIGGVAASTIPSLILGLAAGVACGLLTGVLLSLARRKKDGVKAPPLVTPRRIAGSFIRGNGPLHTAAFSGLAGVLAGLLLHFIVLTHFGASVVHPYSIYLICLVAVIAGTPIGIPDWQPTILMKEPDSLRNPSQQFADERAISLIFAACTIGALIGAVWLLGWTDGGLAIGFLLGCFASLMIERVTEKLNLSWWSYSLATVMLAASGTFPLRLAAFLEDSYEYGLLRRVGGVYQFRHAGFQDYLAKLPGPGADTSQRPISEG